jgi:hypothetical protein
MSENPMGLIAAKLLTGCLRCLVAKYLKLLMTNSTDRIISVLMAIPGLKKLVFKNARVNIAASILFIDSGLL